LDPPQPPRLRIHLDQFPTVIAAHVDTHGLISFDDRLAPGFRSAHVVGRPTDLDQARGISSNWE
jgi:hypothetical protein